MGRRVAAVAVATCLLLATGGSAQATGYTAPPGLAYGPPTTAMPDGCDAAPPAISVVSGFGPYHLLATQVTVSVVTCSAASGYVVASSGVTVQFLNASHIWTDLFRTAVTFTPTSATYACVTSLRRCAFSRQYRRGVGIYTLTNVSTGQPLIVRQSSAIQAPLATPTIPTSDLIARDPDGGLWLYAGDGTGGSLAPRQIGHGWGGFSTIVGPGDFTGDRHTDLIATDIAGALWLYPGNGTGGFLARRQIGNGWGGFTALIAAGDFNGDTHPDLIARDPAGTLWLYPGNGTGGFLPRRQAGTGWNGFDTLIGSADYTGDNHSDVISRDTLGNLWLYPGNGAGGFLTRRQIGTGWDTYGALVGVGDFDGGYFGGAADLIARSNVGGLRLYPGSGTGAFPQFSWIGNGWGAITALVGPGNFDG